MGDMDGELPPADDVESPLAAPAPDESQAKRERAPHLEVAIAAPRKARRMRRRAALGALSALLLVASLVASLYVSGWNFAGLAGSRVALQMTPSGTAGSVTPTGVRDVLSRAAVMPTATASATPTLVGDGSASFGGSWPTYTGPIASGQGCPSGQAPKPVSWAIRGAGDYGAPHLNTVALTFDDGPTPYSSPAILSFLERTHTPATFFVLGQYAKAYPWLVQREAADGFTIGIHTWSHPDMRLLTPAQRAWQFAATAQQLHTDLGSGFCLWLWRPPYGSYDTSIVRQAGLYGLTTIMWNVDPMDWSRPGTMTIVNRVLAQVRPGSIILMHDGPAAREETAAALPYILAGLRARGLTPVSLPQLLLGYVPPTPSPTTTPSPTASPTVTVTPSPTDTPTPTATPDPTATATASMVAGATADLYVGLWWLTGGGRWRRATWSATQT